jgi:energy-coupling factor transport system ATP-binding protein
MRLTLSGIRFSRGSWQLEADAEFNEGTHFVAGAVGSGKSTLALIMAGLIDPDDGEVHRDGTNATMLSLQFPESHVTGATLEEEVRSWGLDPAQVLDDVDLAGQAGTPPLMLSRGELKRLELACVFAQESDLLILDEPFSSLDCIQKHRLCERLEGRSSGVTIIFSHEQHILPAVDAIWEMREGSLVSHGSVPRALEAWGDTAPPHIRWALARGILPANIRMKDVREAACRTYD